MCPSATSRSLLGRNTFVSVAVVFVALSVQGMYALLLCSLLSLPAVSSLHSAVVVTAAASHCDSRNRSPARLIKTSSMASQRSTSTHSCAARFHRSSSEHSLYPHLSTELGPSQ
ncbi:hypothetical protein K466DRAFT_183452 [Polyporus arcularius HHB13444]|uniref:Uncharacterized protein n=1 Tax=Polyporus arcularius HHB13444 TaxID=1314778 RepID=A0A5C3P9H6_9APHY|nr:hypothetical protein K466DRAFT_183452 [Polyporus arcularius HHB13444]